MNVERFVGWGAALVCSLGALGAHAETRLTWARLFASPDLAGTSPRALQLSPDGRLATLLRNRPDDRDRFDLWAIDTATGKARMLLDSTSLETGAEVSEAEKMRRERARIGGTRGLVGYAWAPDGKSLLVPLEGDLFRATLDGRATRLTRTPETELDAQVSKRGRWVSFVRDQNVHLIDTRTGTSRALTTDGAGDVSWGIAEFVAQEEMERGEGHWWSPDDARLVVARVDEGPVASVTRAAIGASGTTTYTQKYPRAGTDNARVDLFVFRPDAPPDAAPVRLDLGVDPDVYVARVSWSADGRRVLVQRQSRDQRRLDLLELDADTGQGRVRLSETSPTWVNLNNDLRALKDGGLLWSSERDGFRHLYLERDGRFEALTRGPWAVTDVVGLDERAGRVFFTAAIETPLERHLYSVELPRKGRAPLLPKRLTAAGGWHDAVMDEQGTRALITRSTPRQPPQTYLADAQGRRITWIDENRVEGAHPYTPWLPAHRDPEFGTLPAEDGTPLHYSHLRPRLAPGQRAPALVIVYGGPGAGQLVTRRWSSLVRQSLVQKGWHVFSLDNRGTFGRGKAFEDALHLAMGGVEARDQAAGVAWLRAQPDVDAERIAIQGWSYGGYLVLKLLQAYPGLYRAGVAGAPVTAWDLYDTHYTERYLGNPAKDRGPYERADVLPAVEKLVDPVLVIHGMADDNVVFENTTALIARLQQSQRLFEVMVYPGQTHRVAGEALNIHLWRTIEDFLERRFK